MRSLEWFKSVAAIHVTQIRWTQPAEAIFRSLHIAQKAIADGGHRGDVARLVSVVSKQTSQQRNAARQGVLGDGAIVPDGVQKLVFCDQPVRIAKQEEQDSKSLRLDRQ